MSYENSFSVIKRDIMKETIEKKSGVASQPMKTKPPKLAISIQFDSIEERPSTVTSSVRQSINKAYPKP